MILQSTPQSLRFFLLADGENSHRSTKNIFAESKTIHWGWSSCPAGRIFSAAIKASYGWMRVFAECSEARPTPAKQSQFWHFGYTSRFLSIQTPVDKPNPAYRECSAKIL